MTANLPNPTPPPSDSTIGTRLRNLSIVLVATVLSVAIFLGLRTDATSVSIAELAEGSTPLEVAIANDRPTLMEFYANWCTSCMAMAPELKELEEQYAGKVNFVMLNVDNTKWLPEIMKYRVDGIPHFVFLAAGGNAIASAIGETPRTVMEANLEALVAGVPLPYAKATGQVSAFEAPGTPAKASTTDPRSHSGQVVN